MFLIKIFHFLKGYVIISVKGNNKEELLNEILRLGAKPSDITFSDNKIFFKIHINDFFCIRKSAVKAKIHIEERHGLLFLVEALKKRRAFLAGLLFCTAFFAVSSQFIWTVEFDGTENCNMQQLEAAVKLCGLKEGTFKRKLKTPLEMKNIILNNTDNICWAWVYINGTKAVVKVRENIIPRTVFDPNQPCDIVAMRDGIIKQVITKRGRRIVKNDEVVTAGQTIISGIFDFEDKNGYLVHSIGTVRAHTLHVKQQTFKQYYCYKTYTGKKHRHFTLKLLKWELPLYIKKNIKQSCYDKNTNIYELKLGKDNYSGLGIKYERYDEFNLIKEPISEETAVEMAKRELEASIAKELLPNSEQIDRRLDVKRIDAETLLVTLTMEFIEQIGTEKEITGVTTIEPKTD